MAPKIRPFTLPDLAAGYQADLEAGGYVELLHFAKLDNPVYADAARLEECRFTSVALASLRNARLLQCEIDQVDVPVMQGGGVFLNDVRVSHSRFGSADLADAELDAVVFEDCKFGWLNLRGTSVRDVIFRNCQFEEIDLGGKIDRVTFEDCLATQVTATGSRLRQVDLQGLDFAQVQGVDALRGATISAMQLGLLAEELADHLGIKVRD